MIYAYLGNTGAKLILRSNPIHTFVFVSNDHMRQHEIVYFRLGY